MGPPPALVHGGVAPRSPADWRWGAGYRELAGGCTKGQPDGCGRETRTEHHRLSSASSRLGGGRGQPVSARRGAQFTILTQRCERRARPSRVPQHPRCGTSFSGHLNSPGRKFETCGEWDLPPPLPFKFCSIEVFKVYSVKSEEQLFLCATSLPIPSFLPSQGKEASLSSSCILES